MSRGSDGSVVRWNPCAVIHYRINPAGLPRGGGAEIQQAVRWVSGATGMRFQYDGHTSVVPQQGYGSAFTPGRAAPPLVFAWALPGRGYGHSNLLSSGSEAGVGGWRAAWWSDGRTVHRMRIVTGYVVLNERYRGLRPNFGVGPTRGELVLHELGHAVGLTHTSDRTQVMYPVLGRYSTLGSGDLAGLRAVGRRAGCIT